MNAAPTPPALLFGATSVVGFTLAREFADLVTPIANPHNRAADAETWHRGRLDEPDEWRSLLESAAPELIIYAHAVCNVGKCQKHPKWARRMNVDCLASVLAQVPVSTRFVYLSSDHIFGGDGAYSESSPPTPISTYGETKVVAERLVLARDNSLVVRFGLPIGPSLTGRTGFYDWLRYRQAQQLPITVIRDESRSAAWAVDVARRVFALSRSDITGVRHVTTTRTVARPELASFLMARMGLHPQFTLRNRAEQPHPHLGHVELTTEHHDELAAPLSSVVPEEQRVTG